MVSDNGCFRLLHLSLSACGGAKKDSDSYAEMLEDEWEALWNEAETQLDSYEKSFAKQAGDYKITERERVSSIAEKFMEFSIVS